MAGAGRKLAAVAIKAKEPKPIAPADPEVLDAAPTKEDARTEPVETVDEKVEEAHSLPSYEAVAEAEGEEETVVEPEVEDAVHEAPNFEEGAESWPAAVAPTESYYEGSDENFAAWMQEADAQPAGATYDETAAYNESLWTAENGVHPEQFTGAAANPPVSEEAWTAYWNQISEYEQYAQNQGFHYEDQGAYQ